MHSTRLTRKFVYLTMLVAMVIGVMPLSVSASSHHTATRSTVSFTSSVIESIEPFEFTADEAGLFHVREVTREDVSGDISGTAIITFSADFRPFGECTEEACLGEESGRAELDITSESGGWSGTYVFTSSSIPGEEYYNDSLILRGTGSNAHSSIVAHSTAGDEVSISFEGVLSTLPLQRLGMNSNVQLCADSEGFSLTGAFFSNGAIDGDGGASGTFLIGGGTWTHSYAVAGSVTLADEHGSVTIDFGGGAQDNFTASFNASHFWGHFVITEGTGAYANLYGSGRLVGTAGRPDAACASGYGISLSMIGESHYN